MPILASPLAPQHKPAKHCGSAALAQKKPQDSEFGGSALEYLIVSLFSLLLAIAAIQFVGQVIKKHATEIETKAGIALELPKIFGDD